MATAARARSLPRSRVVAPSAPAELALVACALLVLLVSCARAADRTAAAPLTVQGGWLRPAAAGTTAEAYFTLVNPGGEPVVVTAAASPQAERVELHAGGAAAARVDTVAVPAGGRVTFGPGATRLLLVGVRRPLVEGVPVQVRFATADGRAVTGQARVRR